MRVETSWPATCRLTAARLYELRREHGLTLADTAVLHWLCDHDYAVNGRRKGYVLWGVVGIADHLGVCDRTVQRALAKLVAAGLISRRQRGRGKSARTTLHWALIASPDTVVTTPQASPDIVTAETAPALTRAADKARKRETAEGSDAGGAVVAPPPGAAGACEDLAAGPAMLLARLRPDVRAELEAYRRRSATGRVAAGRAECYAWSATGSVGRSALG